MTIFFFTILIVIIATVCFLAGYAVGQDDRYSERPVTFIQPSFGKQANSQQELLDQSNDEMQKIMGHPVKPRKNP